MKLIVEGMSCGHCVKAITAAIGRIDASAQVDVDLQAKEVWVIGGVSPQQAAKAVQDEGYDVIAIFEDAQTRKAGSEAPVKTCCGTCQA
ncbi:heavy-metal-associated domain-containing protein [Aerolutibacter daejeonensis]|uniref:heavy-metal-associated domain-containing protein n=1 Tax=Aerolutibacter daejeonensis TaxID=346181 RepID=UPI00055AA3A0|nr:cation transporter [Lysobacter daejeonensis]